MSSSSDIPYDVPQTETATESHDPGILGTFGIRGDLFAAQLINFLIVLIVLWRFVYKPILAILDKREAAIAKSMNDVEEISARMTAAEAERNAMLASVLKESQAIMEGAMHETEVRKNEMLEAAKHEVEQVIAKGKQQLIAEREASLVALRKDVVDIAVRAAAKIVTEGLTEKKSQSLAEEVVRKMT